MNIYLIRHSITAGNLRHFYNGRTDDPLCPEGVALARASGAYPGVERVFVSPLRRTQETAALLFPRAAQTVVPGLQEMDFGDFEGRSADQMAADAPYRAWVDGQCLGRCPGGESYDGFCGRARTAFEALARRERAAERLVLVVHGGTIRAVLSGFAAEPRTFFDWYAHNCRGFFARLRWEDGRPVLRDCRELETLAELAE